MQGQAMDKKHRSKQQIGVLGGTFDPVHQGHLGLARETLEKFGLDRVLFMPAFRSPHKPRTPPAPPAHRLEMLRLALQNDPALEISTIEIQRETLSYTIDTVNSVKLQFPECELSLILGRDNLIDLDSWKYSRKIMGCCHVLVGSRPGVEESLVEEVVLGLFGGDSPYTPGDSENGMLEFRHRTTGHRLVIYQITPRDISSSTIRDRIAGGKPVGNLLPPEVEIYIMNNHLY